MPNWVYTTLFIEGKDSELKKFADFIRNDNYYHAEDDPKKRVHLFDFGKLIPRPAEEEKIGITGIAIIGVLNGMPAMSISTITKRESYAISLRRLGVDCQMSCGLR